MVFEGKLIDLIAKADNLEWSLWVYSEPCESLTPDIQCIVLDVDNTALGADGFTPIEIENRGFQELISMQDLQAVLKKTDNHMVVKAIEYYVKNDAYLLSCPHCP
jgi:hypothetical protein